LVKRLIDRTLGGKKFLIKTLIFKAFERFIGMYEDN
jgi:hypothetical protein